MQFSTKFDHSFIHLSKRDLRPDQFLKNTKVWERVRSERHEHWGCLHYDVTLERLLCLDVYELKHRPVLEPGISWFLSLLFQAFLPFEASSFCIYSKLWRDLYSLLLRNASSCSMTLYLEAKHLWSQIQRGWKHTKLYLSDLRLARAFSWSS